MEYKKKMGGMLAAGAVLGAMAFSIFTGGSQPSRFTEPGRGGSVITVMRTGEGVAVLRQSQGIQREEMAENPAMVLLESASVLDQLDEGQRAAVEALQVQILDLSGLTARLLDECGYGMTAEQQAALELYQSQTADLTQQLRDLLAAYGARAGGIASTDKASGLQRPQGGPVGETV